MNTDPYIVNSRGTVRTHLAGGLAGRSQFHAIRDIVESGLKSFVQNLLGLRSFFGKSLSDILCELTLADAVAVTRLLLLKHLKSEVAFGAGTFPCFFSPSFSKSEFLGLSLVKNGGTPTTG